MKRRTFLEWLCWLLLFERRALRLIDQYIRVGDSLAIKWVGPGGDNANDATTRSLRWLDDTNFTAANLSPGDVIYAIGPATHAYTVAPTVAGASGSLITLRAEPGQEATIDRWGRVTSMPVVFDGQSTRANGFNAVANGIDYWQIVDLGFTGHTGTGVYFSDTAGSERTGHELRRFKVWNNAGAGINARGSTDCVIGLGFEQNNGTTGEASHRAIFANSSDNLLVQYVWSTQSISDFLRGQLVNSTVEFCTMLESYADATHQDGFDLDASCNNLTIRGCWLQDFTQLCYAPLKDNDNSTISNFFFYSNVLVNYLYFDDRAGDCPGVFFDSTGTNSSYSNVQIFSNTFLYMGNTTKAIELPAATGSGDDVRIVNNIFADCRGTASKVAVGVDGTTTNYRRGYNLYHNTADTLNDDLGGDVSGDPLFVGGYSTPGDPGDPGGTQLAVAAGSPARNAGHPDLGSVVTLPDTFLDRDGVLRTGRTIGAYEIRRTQSRKRVLTFRR